MIKYGLYEMMKTSSKLSNRILKDEAVVENASLDYVGGTNYIAKTQYWFVHTLSSLIMVLINNGLRIENFSEHAEDCCAVHRKQEELDAKIPLSYILIGKKRINRKIMQFDYL